jgi:hypothetical protein
MLRKILRLFRSRPRPPPRPADPRLEADPWLGRIFALLGERYQLGADSPEGARVLRRTGRARFNLMPVWLRAAERSVRGDYEVRGDSAAAKALLDARVSGRLSALGLGVAADAVEEWAGTVLTRRYEGRCESPESAAAAVRFVCQESETQVNLAAEG